MNDSSLDQAVIQTMNELMRASSDCAEFDPAMSAKFAAAAKDLGRDLGIKPVETDGLGVADVAAEHAGLSEEEDEDRELLYLLNLQKKAVSLPETDNQPRGRLGWLSLDAWSRW